ncbi:MAG: tRNA (adenosine(37)-N6)-threonylcarbamoyltransferase complex transferase subunit TsaD [Patescibacteria group bacterium]
MNILAIETSFDETACAVIQDGTKIISNILATSHEMHNKYGGVVPEIAARRQLECIIPVIMEALTVFDEGVGGSMSQRINKNIDAIAVTVGPGLIGSLLVGVETAKTLAFACSKPIIPVNHVLAHMFANFVKLQPTNYNLQPIQFPAISLVVSGGHTELYLMKSTKDLMWLGGTLDDAAGECFDKCARILGLGHGGGVAIEKAAKSANDKSTNLQIQLPRPMMHDESLNFSFSGLKTAVMREWKKHSFSVIPAQAGIQPKKNTGSPIRSGMTNAFAYEIQEAITDVLVEKTIRAAKQYGAKTILLSGGVAANQRLREKFSSTIQQYNNLTVVVPEVRLCTDNAVMISAAAYFFHKPTDWHEITAQPDLSVEIETHLSPER